MKTSASPNMRFAKRVFAILAIVFLLLFAGNLVYSLITHRDYPHYNDYGYDFIYSDILEKTGSSLPSLNIATNKMRAAQPGAPDMDQKVERVARLSVKTLRFEADLAKAQSAIEAHGGLVQMENSDGLEGERQLGLTVAVPPEAFDALRGDLAKIGQVTGTETTTRDMTNEYRRLLAEQEGLARRLESYEALKAQGSSLQDRLAVEALIVEADGALQKVRVSLGDYSGERALCTVDFTLYEGGRISLGQEMWDAIVWAAGAFAVAAGVALLAVLLSLAVALLWSHMKQLGQKANEGDVAG